MLKTAGVIVVVLIVGVLIFAAMKPDAFRVQRSTRIKAPPEKIFALINDYKQWALWSPYEKLDPAMKRTYSGAESGKGAVYAWDSAEKKAGAGRMEILESSSPSKITIDLSFTRPFEARNTAEFTLQTQGDTTNVTWAMFGPAAFMMKVMGVFMDVDHMIGKDFETGLATMKAIAEK